LNPIYPGGGYLFDVFEEGIERTSLRGGFETAAVRDVAEDGLSIDEVPGIER
jgi:hypothetical protein